MYMTKKNAEQYFVNNKLHTKFRVPKDAPKGTPHTHTRIGDKMLDIKGGSYDIQDNDAFLRAYYRHVFVRGNTDYLTEKQLEDGPVLIDLDYRYKAGITERQHDQVDPKLLNQVDPRARCSGGRAREGMGDGEARREPARECDQRRRTHYHRRLYEQAAAHRAPRTHTRLIRFKK